MAVFAVAFPLAFVSWHVSFVGAGIGFVGSALLVLVNTVYLVPSDRSLGRARVVTALGAVGGGSILAALLLPRLLDNRPDARDRA